MVFHCAGFVGSHPLERVWQLNALAPRLAVEAAAAEGVPRVVVTSSVAGIGPAPAGRGRDRGRTSTAAAASGWPTPTRSTRARRRRSRPGRGEGVEVVIVNPSYVFGVPVDRTAPGETSTRMIGNYLRGRLPAVVDGETNVVDVRDVAKGHLRAAERGRPGERYVLGGHDIALGRAVRARRRACPASSHPLLVLPREAGALARAAEAAGLPSPISAEGLVLMAQNWRYSSAKARRELGYRARALDRTLTDTIDWYRELIASGTLGGGRPSALSLAAAGMRVADRAGALGALRLAERYVGRGSSRRERQPRGLPARRVLHAARAAGGRARARRTTTCRSAP